MTLLKARPRPALWPTVRDLWLHRPVIGIFSLTIAITLIFWLLLPASLRVDDGSDYSAFYEPVARNLVAGHGLLLPDGSAATRYPPGYPFVLAGGFAVAALLHLPEGVVQAVITLLCLGTAATLLWTVARSVWGIWPATGGGLTLGCISLHALVDQAAQ